MGVVRSIFLLVNTHIIHQSDHIDWYLLLIETVLQSLDNILADSVRSLEALCEADEFTAVDGRLIDRETEARSEI